MTATQDLIELAEFRFGDAGDDIVSEAQWLSYMQIAYDEANGFSPFWPFTEVIDTTVAVAAGTNSVSLESEQPGMWRVRAVHNTTDDYPLSALDGTPYRDYPTEAADLGSPETYRQVGNTLYIFPFTDHTINLKVEGYKPPAPLVNDTTSPAWPPEFHYALVDGALALAYADDGNAEWAKLHYERFQSAVLKMEEALLSGARTEAYPGIVDPLWW